MYMFLQEYTEEFRDIAKGIKTKEALPTAPITLIHQRPVAEDLHVIWVFVLFLLCFFLSFPSPNCFDFNFKLELRFTHTLVAHTLNVDQRISGQTCTYFIFWLELYFRLRNLKLVELSRFVVLFPVGIPYCSVDSAVLFLNQSQFRLVACFLK